MMQMIKFLLLKADLAIMSLPVLRGVNYTTAAAKAAYEVTTALTNGTAADEADVDQFTCYGCRNC